MLYRMVISVQGVAAGQRYALLLGCFLLHLFQVFRGKPLATSSSIHCIHTYFLGRWEVNSGKASSG